MFTKDVVTYRGVPFEWGNDILIVPPLPLGKSKEIQKKMAALSANMETETKEESVAKMDNRVAIIVEAATLALRRNYPDITDEAIADGITQNNMNDLFSAALYGTVPTKTAKTLPEAQTVLQKALNPMQTVE